MYNIHLYSIYTKNNDLTLNVHHVLCVRHAWPWQPLQRKQKTICSITNRKSSKISMFYSSLYIFYMLCLCFPLVNMIVSIFFRLVLKLIMKTLFSVPFSTYSYITMGVHMKSFIHEYFVWSEFIKFGRIWQEWIWLRVSEQCENLFIRIKNY